MGIVRADNFSNGAGTGAPDFADGLQVKGVELGIRGSATYTVPDGSYTGFKIGFGTQVEKTENGLFTAVASPFSLTATVAILISIHVNLRTNTTSQTAAIQVNDDGQAQTVFPPDLKANNDWVTTTQSIPMSWTGVLNAADVLYLTVNSNVNFFNTSVKDSHVNILATKIIVP